jgi:beta-lactamase superfamily II metal-dependent hydrolase
MELTVLRLPGGAAAQHLRVGRHHWLLDSGSEEHFPFLVRPCLQHLGVNHLDGLLLSHSDYEHVGAALRIQREFRQPPMWQPTREPWPWETGDSSFRRLQGHGLRAAPLKVGEILDLGSTPPSVARATVLYPPDGIWPRRSDDRALVLRLDLGSFRVLWCNDSGFLAEKTMLETQHPDALRSDVVIRNQHAADFSLLPEFLNAVQPRAVVSSNDDFPPEQKVSSRVRVECAKRGIALIDQRETGAVTLSFWPGTIELFTMRGGQPIRLPAMSHEDGR